MGEPRETDREGPEDAEQDDLDRWGGSKAQAGRPEHCKQEEENGHGRDADGHL
jgi:hypothetical protein